METIKKISDEELEITTDVKRVVRKDKLLEWKAKIDEQLSYFK